METIEQGKVAADERLSNVTSKLRSGDTTVTSTQLRNARDDVEGYNHHHRHTGIGLNTPADVHYGHAAAKATERSGVLAEARQRHPERFATTNDPKILTIPDAAWTNQPATDNIELAA